MEQEALQRAVAGLRRSFGEGAFSPEAPRFDVDEIRTRTEYVHPSLKTQNGLRSVSALCWGMGLLSFA
jgi:hypothetical protein